MNRFTLKQHTWYACEFFDAGFSAEPTSYSPIRVECVTPQEDGSRPLVLDFYHANYPEGVRNKQYRLQTINRGSGFLLAKSLDQDPPRHLRLQNITPEWLHHHLDWDIGSPADLQQRLDREAGFAPSS